MVEGWNYISTFYFSARIRRKYVNLCEKAAISENKTSIDKNMGKIDNDMFLFIIVLFLSIDVLFSSEDSTVWKTVPSVARVTRDEVSGL